MTRVRKEKMVALVSIKKYGSISKQKLILLLINKITISKSLKF